MQVETPAAPTDLSGYWVLSKTENLDAFLKTLGFPWVIRKAALKFGSSAVDIISHTGSTCNVTTLNAKGSWSRVYDTQRTVEQKDALGVRCKTASWWEGSVLRTRLEGNPVGVCESWRYLRGNVMVTKTAVRRSNGAEATCYWFSERLEALESHLSAGLKPQLLRAIKKDQHRVRTATQKDTTYLQTVLLDAERWISPADEFIHIETAAPSCGGSPTLGRHSASRARNSAPRLRGNVSPASITPYALSNSPSSQSLVASPSGSDITKSRLGMAAVDDRQASAAAAVSSAAIPAVSSAPRLTNHTANAAFGGTNGTTPAAIDVGGPSVTTPPPSSLGTHPTRVWSSDAASIAATSVSRRAVHYRSPSADSIPSTLSQATPLSGPSQLARTPPTGPEALMVLKFHEYLDSRGISTVVPVTQPNDTNEPQLLEMSPEQAEDTAARLRELETELLLHRQGAARGWLCCGVVISKEADSLPEHLRVWEMTLA